MASETLELNVKGTASEFVQAIAEGWAREIFCFGTRGERKTNSAFIGFIQHAREHAKRGFSLPVKWIGVTDTFQSHKEKTVPSMQLPFWKGAWKLSEGNHVANFVIGGQSLVQMSLFGIEDQGAMDRVRRECHGVWFEEPAPVAVLAQSSGVSETAWLTALTSQRMETHAKVAVATLNYPDEDHWTWQRAIVKKEPGTMFFRIPPGENASAHDRAEWERALASRPDLLRRLLQGMPGVVLLGKQVAQGFREDRHVSDNSLTPIKGEPLIFAWDGGHTPGCIIGQMWRGFKRFYVSLVEQKAGVKQLIQNQVIPWLSVNAKWALENPSEFFIHGYDPSMATKEQADIDQSPALAIEELLGGQLHPGPVSWDDRKGPMLSSFTQMVDGDPSVQIDRRGCDLLIKALSGRWYYAQNRMGEISRDIPKKPNHPWEDLGDMYCYWNCLITPVVNSRYTGPIHVESSFDPRQPFQDHAIVTDHSFNPRERYRG